jgi:hypothetical protein
VIVRLTPHLLALVALACGRAEPAANPTPSPSGAAAPAAPATTPPPETSPADAPPAETPPAETPPAETPPAETPPAVPPATTDAIASALRAPLPAGPIAAFAIVGHDTTIVAPVDPTIAPLRVAGIWVLDDATATPKVSFHAGVGAAIPTCACDRNDACGEEVSDADGEGPICSCRAPGPVDDGVDEGGECEFMDPRPAGLVGGVLYMQVDTHNTCEGMNLYGEDWYPLTMVASPTKLSGKGLKPRGCDPGVATGVDVLAPRPDPPPCGPRETDGGCDVCDAMSPNLEVFAIQRGELVHLEEDADTVGGGVRRWSSRALTPKTCPSSADTCGRTTAFPQVERADGFWIANDGTHALTLQRDGTLAIVSASGTAALGKHDDDILGVRYHADARALITTMAARAPSGTTTCEVGDTPVSWGTQCVEHMRAGRLEEARAACEQGLDETTKPAARGALLYNLGVIAQRSGDTAAARKHFEDSLAARPGNAAVRKALAALGPG